MIQFFTGTADEVDYFFATNPQIKEDNIISITNYTSLVSGQKRLKVVLKV